MTGQTLNTAYNRPLSWWDDLCIPTDVIEDKRTFSWLEEQTRTCVFDYVMYTDGSGAADGFCSSACIVVDSNNDTSVVASAYYGGTVHRAELEALLNGIYRVVSNRTLDRIESGVIESAGSKQRVRDQITGDNRLRILWYTDRRDIALGMLYDEENNLLNSRDSDEDLWARWGVLQRYCVVTPIYKPRNTEHYQHMADSVCKVCRNTFKEAVTNINDQKELQWTRNKIHITKKMTQRALL